MSSFHGLEMARQALATQQLGLHTTGHNISNINTEGYSRQRVNFETMTPYPNASRTARQMPGQIGTGVRAESVERVRDQFLDMQYRTQNSRSSYWETKANALHRLEGTVNEMDDTDAIGAGFDEFWKSLSDLATSADNGGARHVAAQKALALAETFNSTSKTLETIRTDLKFQIDKDGSGESGALGEANALLKQIHNLNEQIKEVEPHGQLPNDLYDRRDVAIDKLSKIVDVRVSYEKSGNGALDIAGGLAKVELVNGSGEIQAPPGVLVGKGVEPKEFTVEYDDENKSAVKNVQYGGEAIEYMEISGSLKALIESYGYIDESNGEVAGQFPDFMNKLDTLVKEFAKEFNVIHKEGFDLSGEQSNLDFFVIGTDGAKTITVNSEILKDPSLIAAGATGTTGNGENAHNLADVINGPLKDNDTIKNGSIKEFYNGIIGELAVVAMATNNEADISNAQRHQVEQSRLSITAVSLDEEVTNLLRFQHAYNAAARSLTATDELLEKIINGMGVVGR